ncbi:MAG TPA: carboxypeptidase-like regulatory domain-containing protein [Chryseolinea sp.]
MRNLFIFALAAFPLACQSQFIIKGTVRDSTNQQGLPGVNVIISATNASVVTNEIGYFEIESKTPTAEVTFAFIGLITKNILLSASETAIVSLETDEAGLPPRDHFVKISLNAGYFGDVKAAPMGFMVYMPVQSIGRLSLGLFPTFKYWSANNNRGTELSISKHLPYSSVAALPDNLFLAYRSIAYQESGFNLKQARGLIVNELRGRFALDVGAAYSQLGSNDVQRTRTETYFSGLLGLAKIFQGRGTGDTGLYASLNYHPSHVFYEAGAFRSFGIRKRWATVLVKYFNYEDIKGVMLGVSTNIFSTRYYCCDSWEVHYDELSVLR